MPIQPLPLITINNNKETDCLMIIENPRIKNQNPQQFNPILGNKKCKKYFMLDSNTKIYFNADFDSGNLEKVEQVAPYIYKLYPGYDRVTNSTNKTYFHFKVFGFKNCTVRLLVARVQILEKLLKNDQQGCYKPVVRKGKGKYEPLEKGVKIYMNKSDEAELSIDYQFGDEEIWTYFSFSFPYSYEDMINLVKQLKLKYVDHPQIYFHEEVLGYSQEGRKLQIISITERANCTKQRQEDVRDLFPDRLSNLSVAGFKINKPKIIISGRVHPGETPASYCIEGLLRFLLDEKDYRAYLLRKNFHFIIVPMLNPDGVYHGMFRNDINGENLNRLYVNCIKQKHPTIWSFRQYLKSLQLDDEPVLFYFDFHAHPSKKQFFIYGNAFNEFTHQVEAQTFGRLLQNNCPYFHNIDSIFTEKQMSSKDRYDVHTKQGCARVFVHRLFNIIHSYTVQCGYFAPGKLQKWQSFESIIKRSQVFTKEYSYISSWEQCSTKTYTPESYMLMGKSILVTVLDLFHLNPYSRINFNELRSIATIRKTVGIKIYNSVERFRMIDPNVTKKIKELSKLLEEDYYKVRVGEFGLSISENYGMKHPKKRFSLMSRVYMSKKDLLLKIGTPEALALQQQCIQQQNYQEPIQEEPDLDFLHKNEAQANHAIQVSVLAHSSNFRQYKSQLQLKALKMKQSDKKLQQSYLNQISHQCLHVSKAKPIISDLYNIEYNHDSQKQEDMQNIEQINQNGVKTERKMEKDEMKDRKIVVIDKNFAKFRKRETEKSLNLLKVDGMTKKRTGTQEKVDRNQYSLSTGKPDSNRKTENESKVESIMELKSARIDKFLKKQSNTAVVTETSELQKYITNKVQEEMKKIPGSNIVSRFPSIYAKYTEAQTGRARK